jgi:hypothetical protein
MNQDAQALKAYLNEVSRNRRVIVYDRLTEVCKVPRSTVSNWRNGRTRIKEVYKDLIEEAAGKKIFNR